MTQQDKQFFLLMKKARQDEYILEKLVGDEDAPVEIFGFHAQQASEKILKAVLAKSGLLFPPTHRLVELIDLAKDGGIEVPDQFEEIRHLTPFAVEYRYDVFEDAQFEPLDKEHIRQLVHQLHEWAEITRFHKTGNHS
ncbi:HEPN domain-containing protein [bacterium]|nr:HEPN domain-containing protein [bacterium]